MCIRDRGEKTSTSKSREDFSGASGVVEKLRQYYHKMCIRDSFYRHVLIEGGFPHHGAVAFGHFGQALFEVFKYIGVPVEEIGYNQPAGVRYPTENPWG